MRSNTHFENAAKRIFSEDGSAWVKELEFGYLYLVGAAEDVDELRGTVQKKAACFRYGDGIELRTIAADCGPGVVWLAARRFCVGLLGKCGLVVGQGIDCIDRLFAKLDDMGDMSAEILTVVNEDPFLSCCGIGFADFDEIPDDEPEELLGSCGIKWESTLKVSYCRIPPQPSLQKVRAEVDSLDEAAAAAAFSRDVEMLRGHILEFIMKHHKDPLPLLGTLLKGKYVLTADGVSDLVVNNNLDIVLPQYDECIVEMESSCKALYILFLKHPEGIVLKRIDEYKKELREILDIVKDHSESVRDSVVDNMCNPMKNVLNQKLSMIKAAFKRKMPIAECWEPYVVKGCAGGPYGVALERSKVTLPQVFG